MLSRLALPKYMHASHPASSRKITGPPSRQVVSVLAEKHKHSSSNIAEDMHTHKFVLVYIQNMQPPQPSNTAKDMYVGLWEKVNEGFRYCM